MLTISLTSLSVLLSSCVSKPKDSPFCRQLHSKTTVVKDAFGIPVTTIRANPDCAKNINEPDCLRCAWLISDKVQYVGEAPGTWLYGKPKKKILEEAVIAPSESFAAQKAYIVKACKAANCDKEIPKWRVKLDSLDSIAAPTP